MLHPNNVAAVALTALAFSVVLILAAGSITHAGGKSVIKCQASAPKSGSLKLFDSRRKQQRSAAQFALMPASFKNTGGTH